MTKENNLQQTVQQERTLKYKALETSKYKTDEIAESIKARHVSALIEENIAQIVRTQELIDRYKKQGKLSGKSLELAEKELRTMSESLLNNLYHFENE